MKVGSLVVIKPLPEWRHLEFAKDVKWMPLDDESTIYTVREVIRRSYDCVLLEEGCIGISSHTGLEIAVVREYVVEIQPPMKIDIEELLTQTCEV